MTTTTQPAYRLKRDRFQHKAGTIVYAQRFHDYGLAGDDTRHTGVEHVTVTLNANGDYPGFTVPRHDLEALPAESVHPAIAAMQPLDSDGKVSSGSAFAALTLAAAAVLAGGPLLGQEPCPSCGHFPGEPRDNPFRACVTCGSKAA